MKWIFKSIIGMISILIFGIVVLQWPPMRDPLVREILKHFNHEIDFKEIEGLFPLHFSLLEPNWKEFKGERLAIVFNPWNWSSIPYFSLKHLEHPSLCHPIDVISGDIHLVDAFEVHFKLQAKELQALGNLSWKAHDLKGKITFENLILGTWQTYLKDLQGSSHGELDIESLSKALLTLKVEDIRIQNQEIAPLDLQCSLANDPSAKCSIHSKNLDLKAVWKPHEIIVESGHVLYRDSKLSLLTPVSIQGTHHSPIYMGMGQGHISLTQEGTSENFRLNKVNLHFASSDSEDKTHLILDGQGRINVNDPEKPYQATLGISFPLIKTNIKAALEGNRSKVSWQAQAKDPKYLDLKSQGSYEIEKNHVQGTLHGYLQLKILEELLKTKDRYEAKVLINLKAEGPLEVSSLTGTLGTTQGVYENAAIGTAIHHIVLQGTLRNSLFTFTQFYGEDIFKGTIKGRGTVRFDEEFMPFIDLQAHTEEVTLAQTDELKAIVTGDISLHGLGTSAQLKGHFDVLSLSYLLGDQPSTPQSIRINSKTKTTHPTLLHPVSLPLNTTWIPLNLVLHLKRPIHIEGFGLNSYWDGSLSVQGGLKDPYLVGALDLTKGRFEFLGKQMKIKEGQARFEASHPNDPWIDIQAIREGTQITVLFNVNGHTSNPQFKFSSTPELPLEDIMARLLFDKSLAQVSSTQNLQISSAMASTQTGNPLNVFDRLRGLFGFDSLEFKHAEADPTQGGGGQGSIVLGKQISENVTLRVDQSIDGREGKFGMDIKVTPRFSVEIDVGGAQSAGVGLNWSKRY